MPVSGPSMRACKPGHSLSEDDIIAPLQSVLARFKQPKRVYFLDVLPRNAMGKIQKKELREQFADTFQS